MLLDFLYPKVCPGCGKIMTKSQRTFCTTCLDQVIFTDKNTCLKCGKPIEDNTKELCFDCNKKTRYFDEHRAAYVYKGVLRHAMYGFKYANKRCYAKLFARDIVLKNYDWLCRLQVDAIVPIPMYEAKKKIRGYNQAEKLADEISKMINVPVNNALLVRCKNTIPMKNLTDVQRRINLENAFICKGFNVKYNRLLLVDDIFTTGATFDSVASVLKANGVEKIYCVSVCVGWGS